MTHSTTCLNNDDPNCHHSSSHHAYSPGSSPPGPAADYCDTFQTCHVQAAKDLNTKAAQSYQNLQNQLQNVNGHVQYLAEDRAKVSRAVRALNQDLHELDQALIQLEAHTDICPNPTLKQEVHIARKDVHKKAHDVRKDKQTTSMGVTKGAMDQHLCDSTFMCGFL